MARDPTCGMEVEERDAEFMTHMEHETFYFCSKACQETFDAKEGFSHEDKDKKWWQKILKEPKGAPPKCH